MRKNSALIIFFLGICFLFFYPIFFGKIPFPGDLLISEYSPWRYFSFLGYAPGGYPQKFQYFDTLRQLYPWTTFTVNSLWHMQFPLWNPHNFSGSPLFANSQSAVLYPFHILYLLLPQNIAWTILIMLQPLLSSIFTYLYARKLGIGKLGSILSSLSFGYSLFSTVFLEYNTIGHVIIFLPFLLWLIELLFEKRSAWRMLLFVSGIACAAFAGHIQIFGFVIFFTFIYVFFKLLSQKNQKVQEGLCFLALFILGIGAAMIQLLPTFELIRLAARSFQDYAVITGRFLLQPHQLTLFLSPDIFGNPATKSYLFGDSYPGNAVYIGLFSFIFAVSALLQLRKNKTIRFFAWSIFLLLLFFVRSPFTQFFYKLNIPLFSTGSPSNAFFLLGFCLSILAGFGFEHFLEKKEKKVLAVGFVLLLIFLSSVGLFKVTHIPFIWKNIVYTVGFFVIFSTLCAGLFIFPKYKKYFAILFLVFVICDLFYFFQKFNPFVDAKLIFPPTPMLRFLQQHEGYNRFWSYGNAMIMPNFATQYGLYDANGYDPLYPKTYGLFLGSISTGKIPTEFSSSNRSDALLPDPFSAEQLLKNKNELKTMNLLGIKYIVSTNDPTTYLLPTEKFKLVFNTDIRQIFENTDALPRAFLVYKTLSYTTPQNFTNIFYSESFNPANTVLLPNQQLQFSQGTGNAKIELYTANKISITTISTTDALLFLPDSYFPGWKAYVDGKTTKILPADFAFRAVRVPAGSHRVVFRYQPTSFTLGLALSILSVGTSFAFAWLVTRKKI